MSKTRAKKTPIAVESLAAALDLVVEAAQDGAADAHDLAVRIWAATSLFAARFVYTTCYTVSFGVVFPTVLLAQSIPRDNAVARGLIDGAQAAIRKVDQLRSPSSDTTVPALASA